MQPSYTPPDDPRSDWSASFCDSFAPTERQKLVINAVEQAIAAGMAYADEVIEFAKQVLCPADEHLREDDATLGTIFGRDIACALHYLRGQSPDPRLAPRGQSDHSQIEMAQQ